MTVSNTKKLISIRLEQDLLEWFKSQREKGYQTLIHSVLKDYVSKRREQDARKAGRAQELFSRFYAQCFWHYSPDLKIDSDNIQLVIDGLRKYGGREGFMLSAELCG